MLNERFLIGNEKEKVLDIYKKYNFVRPADQDQTILRAIYESGTNKEDLNESKKALADWYEQYNAIRDELAECLLALDSCSDSNKGRLRRKVDELKTERQELLDGKDQIEANIQLHVDYLAYCNGHFR